MYNDLILLYKIVNGLVPISLPSYISITRPENVRYTRRNALIQDLTDTSTLQCSVIPNCEAFRNQFFYRTLQRWNSLPVSVRQASTTSTFKSLLTNFLWSCDNDWPD